MGEALVNLQFMGKIALEQKTSVASLDVDGRYSSQTLDNACKHGVNLTEFRQRKLKNNAVFEN